MIIVDTVPSPSRDPLEHEWFIRSLSRELPRPVGAGIATIVVLVSLAAFLWSLVETWQGTSQNALPLFQVVVAGALVSAVALYARTTFSYVVALIGAVAWVWVSMLPLVPVVQCLLQAVTVTVMVIGVNFALAAVDYNTRPRF